MATGRQFMCQQSRYGFDASTRRSTVDLDCHFGERNDTPNECPTLGCFDPDCTLTLTPRNDRYRNLTVFQQCSGSISDEGELSRVAFLKFGQQRHRGALRDQTEFHQGLMAPILPIGSNLDRSTGLSWTPVGWPSSWEEKVMGSSL